MSQRTSRQLTVPRRMCTPPPNASGLTVTSTAGDTYTVRPGTDMIEVRGVINSPLIGFDLDKAASGCGTCNGVNVLTAKAVTGDPLIGTSFIDALKLFYHVANIGDARSLVHGDTDSERLFALNSPGMWAMVVPTSPMTIDKYP